MKSHVMVARVLTGVSVIAVHTCAMQRAWLKVKVLAWYSKAVSSSNNTCSKKHPVSSSNNT